MDSNNNVDPSLVRSIREQLRRGNFHKPQIRVSVAREPMWEPTLHNTKVLVRWLCWSIEDGGREVCPPIFEVLSKDVTKDRLAKELPKFFEDLEVTVDHDIDV